MTRLQRVSTIVIGVILVSVMGSGLAAEARPPGARLDGAVTSAPSPLRVLPIGSSTMDGNTVEPNNGPAVNAGARPDLWHLLSADQPVDFVGPSHDADQASGDRDHAGVNGDISVFRANIDAWLATYQPDAVLLHGGAREVLSETYDLARLPADLGGLVDRMFEVRPGVAVYLSTIGPITEDGADDVNRTLRANEVILEVVRTRMEAGRRIRLLDNRARIGAADASGDRIHLNASGYAKAASGWYGGIAGVVPVRLEAEHGTVGGLARVLDTYYASGKRKVGYIDDAASFVQVVFNAPYTGHYRVAIRGGTGIGQPSTHGLSVNGGPRQPVTYQPYGWERWTPVTVDVDLRAGQNTLRLTREAGFAEVDFVEVMVPTGARRSAGPRFYTRDALDRLTYLARSTDGNLRFGRQRWPGGGWLDSPVGAPVTGTPAVTLDAAGRTSYLARTADGNLRHGWEQTPGGLDWRSVLLVPAVPVAGDPVATQDSEGRLVYVARSAAGELVAGRQDAPDGRTFEPLRLVDVRSGSGMAVAGEPAAVLDRDGALTVAARTADGRLLLARQTQPGSAMFATTTLGSPSSIQGRPGVGLDANGFTSFVARRPDGKLQHGRGLGTDPARWTSTMLEPTTDHGAVEAVTPAGDPAIAQDVNGKLTYTVRTTDGRILHGWQHAAATGPWHATILPTLVGGRVDGDPQLALDHVGRLTYAARSGNRLVHGWQNTPGLGPWHTTLIGGSLGS